MAQKVRITAVSIEAGDYAKSKQGCIGDLVSISPEFTYVDFKDGNDGRTDPSFVSGFPFLKGEFELIQEGVNSK